MKVSQKQLLVCMLLCLLSACNQAATPSPTSVVIHKELVTVAISPTPDAAQVAATRAAISPTPNPPTATLIPTETPYIGIFIGEADAVESFVNITEPLFGEVLNPAQPTADTGRCLTVAIDAPYLTAWRTNPTVNQRLGCPIQGGFGFFGDVQIFENGVMYAYPEINAVWAVRPTIDQAGVYDYLENPPNRSTSDVAAPQGLLVPDGIFGNMWATVAEVRSDMGFARTRAQESPLGLQRFENGTFLLDSNAAQVYALVADGTLLGPFLASEVTPALVATPTPAVAGTLIVSPSPASGSPTAISSPPATVMPNIRLNDDS